MRNSQIDVLQVKGNFGDHLEVRKVNKTKNQRLEGKMGKSETIVSGVKDTIRNTSARMANALSGSEGAKIDTVKLRDVERLLHLEGGTEIAQKELGDFRNSKMWLI